MEVPFKEFSLLEARLGQDLTLQQIEEIEQQIVNQTTDKTQGVATSLLNRCEAKKPALIDRQIRLLDQTSDPNKKIKLLTPLMEYLDPDVVDEKLEEITFNASLSENTKVQEAVKRLRFAIEKPIVQDLDRFSKEAKKVAKAVRETQSFAPLQEWNAAQLGEVSRAATLRRT